MSALISIIIPVYNTSEFFLSRCLNSFNCEKDSRIEIIIVDDGSEYSTVNQIRQFTQNCINDVKFYKQENGGQNSARTLGIKKAHGKYICFIDSDDYINWQQFKLALDYVHNSFADIIDFNFYRNNKICRYNYNNHDIKQQILCNCSELWRIIIRRDFVFQYLPLYDQVKIGEDIVSVFLLVSKANVIVHSDIAYYYYSNNDDSMTHIANAIQRLQIIFAFQDLHKVISIDYINEFIWQVISHVILSESRALLNANITNLPYVFLMRNWMNISFKNWKRNKYIHKKITIGNLLLIRGCYYIYIFLKKLSNK